MDAYKAYLIALATGRHYPQPDAVPPILDPPAFLAEQLIILVDMDTTMAGMNAFADAIFAHPAFAPLIENADNRQTDVYRRLVPHFTPLLKRYWEQIIVPAWNQYAGLQ